VSQGDVQTLFGILNENLREGVTDEKKTITISGGRLSCYGFHVETFICRMNLLYCSELAVELETWSLFFLDKACDMSYASTLKRL